MSVFYLSAWTANPDGIPRSSEFLLEEPNKLADTDPNHVERFAVGMLRFTISIHVWHSTDYRFPSPQPPPPAARGWHRRPGSASPHCPDA